ncbi:MAG: hypothetical protein GF353_14515 [Candidatus Lokiarchaeota archaeon]|nr:hypothetical protein [Candidatus Lokiarchaeota archaeon]
MQLGILVFILPFINPALFLSEEFGVSYYEDESGVPAIYTNSVLISLISLTLPFVIGLWSIGWALEDSGLMHYKFDNRPGKPLYEIEPVYQNYSSYLRGYAGVSSVLFLVQVIITWASVTVEPKISDGFFTILILALVILFSIPAYVIYAKFVAKKIFSEET